MRCSLRSVLTLVASFSFVVLASGSLWAAPVISSLNPTSGATGTSVVITGSNFGSTQGTSTVKFAGVVAAVTNWSNTGTSITATVPSGIPNGNGTVLVTVGGVQSNGKTFTVTNPSISSLSINSAPVDQEITINGSNFGSSQGSSTVTFNGTSAIPSFWSSSGNQIAVPVPAGATTGNLVVTVNGNSSPAVTFMVTPPTPQPAGLNFIQGNYLAPTTSGTSIQVQYPIEQIQSDLNLVLISYLAGQNVTISSVTDSAGNSYALAVGPTSSSNRTQAIYYAKNISYSATNTVTVTYSAAPSVAVVRIAEFSGLDQNNPVDITHAATGTSTTPDSGFATTTNANDLLVGAEEADSITNAPGTGYTNIAIILHHSLVADIIEDKVVTATGSYHATATLATSRAWVMQMIAFRQSQNQPPVVNAGPNQTITLPTSTVTLNGTATDDGLPNNTLTISWTKVSGPGTVTFSSPSTTNTQATFSTYGTYVLQLTANDSKLSSSSNVTVTVNPQPTSLVLTPSIAGPNVTGTNQTMSATLTIANTGTPISGASVQFTVTGPNATSGNSTTNSSGIATFSYVGSNQGTDTVQSSSNGTSSNSASVSWITPVQPISTSTIFGRFFTSNGSGIFNIPPTATPVFTQEFPTIDFDPPAGTIPGNTSGVNVNTRPFTDVTTDLNGNFTGIIVAQGNGVQAGAGLLNAFQAVFTGAFTVKNAGNITINMFSDDGFVLGVNGGATRVSGPMINVPTGGVTPFQQYTVVASFNQAAAPTGNTLVVNFPAPGTYQYELDYTECCGGQDVLTMAVGTPNSTGTAPTGSLAITPTNPASINTGQTETLTVQASDASGAPIPNLGVAFIIDGANMQFLNGTTNSNGQATLQYTGVHGGTDTVQAVANITGMGSLSNVVTVPWNVPAGGGCGTYIFTPQGWISSPAIGAVVQGQVPITLASGITLTSGTLKIFPTANPSQVTILNSNTTGTGPLTLGTVDATLLINGEYTIQLQATTSAVACQLNEIVVSVTGQNKLGRQTVSVTDFTVPLAGIPVKITRTYDSLNRGTVGDFGNGWTLGTNVQLSVDQLMDVTFTWNGKRQTFYFTPQSNGSALFPWLLVPHYTPQPGLYGTLTSNGCSALMQVGGALLQDTTGVFCFPSGTYQPTIYTYTDPAGRAYTISSTGQLQSIKDLNGNTLTVAPSGITSSVNGVLIPFVRDGSGRITQITDLNNNNYTYSYDGNGNLQSVQYPGLTQAETYTYATDHSLLTDTDPRGNTSSATYYDSTNDGGNSQLDGRLKSMTQPTVSDANGNPVQYTTQYAYNLTTKTTTTTNPDGGTITRTDDSFGNPLSITEQVNGSTSRTTTYQYDSRENLVKVIHPCGNSTCSDTTGNDTWNYTYDANGFQTSIQDPLGHTSQKTYNQFGGVLTSTDAANTNTQTVTYDAFLNPVQVTDLLNGAGTQVSSSTFDSLGNTLTSTDANNKTTQFAYDPNGNLIQVADPLNQITHFTYDSMDRQISQTDPLNNTTLVTYDALGRLKTRTDALNKTTTYNYDNNGNKISETDANNHTTQYQYDALNRLTQISYPDTTTKQFRYDFRGNKLVEIDQSGRTTKYVYDLGGQLTTKTYAFGTADAATVSYTYDLDGRVAATTDELNNVATSTYDASGNFASVKDALNHTTSYSHDADNRTTSIQDANGNTASYAYDKRSRLTTITYPATATQGVTTTQYNYDALGRELTVTDQASKVTMKTYDAAGRLTSVKDALNNTTNYFYDANGNLTFLQDVAGRVTAYQYDKLNRRSVRTLPLNQIETYTYDAVGNLATHTDFNGLKTTFSYDTLNRLLSKVPQSGTGISFTYTPTGQRLTMTDPSGTTNYSAYDNRDRLLTKATPEGMLIYTYDAHGNVLSINSSNTNGASMTYTYDALNRLASTKDNRIAAQGGPSNPTTYSYDPAGNLSGYLYPNAVQTNNVFDQLSRLTQTCSATSAPACSAGSKFASYAYTLGNAGNRTNVLDLNNRNVAYGYDNDYRLTSEAITADPAGNNGTVSYVYDVVGNRAQMTSTLNAVPGGSFFYDANDRLTTDSYDNNGNTTSSGGISNTYDFENRMLTHGALTLVYDGDGNRISETVGGTTTKFLVDDHNPTGLPQVLDELVSGSVTHTYAYGLHRINENQQISGTWTPRFYGYDGHGNARFLANAAGTITDTYQFDAFGAQIAGTGTTPNPYLYSGERFDSNLSLYHLRARYYNVFTGRFETMDPDEGDISNPATLHKYVFTADNPVNWLDPTGQAVIAEYNVLVAKNRGSGLQAHHIIPQRFARTLGAAYCTIAIELTPAEHLVFTNLWGGMSGGVLPYGGVYTAEQIFAAAKEVYWGFPKIQQAVEWCKALAEIP